MQKSFLRYRLVRRLNRNIYQSSSLLDDGNFQIDKTQKNVVFHKLFKTLNNLKKLFFEFCFELIITQNKLHYYSGRIL